MTGYPVYDRAVGSCFSRGGRLTLLGDAAHPMAPFKGQGANQALVDAIALARAIYDSEVGDAAAAAMEALARSQEGKEETGEEVVAMVEEARPAADAADAADAAAHRGRPRAVRARRRGEGRREGRGVAGGDAAAALGRGARRRRGRDESRGGACCSRRGCSWTRRAAHGEE